MSQRSDDITKLAVALLKSQMEIGKAHKAATNPFFKSKYADLSIVIEAVKGPLNDHGITFLQAIDANEAGQPVIETILLHDSGQFISSRTPVFCSKPNDPQAFGSGVTYSKRYALQSIMGLPTADDDAEAAMVRNKKPQPKPNPSSRSKAPAERPELGKVGLEVVSQAFFNFETAHADEMAAGFTMSLDLFTDAVWKHYGRWPVSKESVPKIVDAIKLTDVMTEIKK